MSEEKPESEWTIEEWKEMRDALVTENEWFKAQLAAIPWREIWALAQKVWSESDITIVEDWVIQNVPENDK